MTIMLQRLASFGFGGKNCKRRKMSLSILDIAPVLAGDPDQQITWFQQRGLIARNKTCPSCSSVMHMQCRNDIQDKRRYSHVPKSIKHSIFCGWIAFQFDNRWRCVDDGCKKSCSTPFLTSRNSPCSSGWS